MNDATVIIPAEMTVSVPPVANPTADEMRDLRDEIARRLAISPNRVMFMYTRSRQVTKDT